MAYTQEQVDALEAAIATGAMTVESTDAAGRKQKVLYKSLEQQLAILDLMKRSIASAQPRRRTFSTLRTNRGLGRARGADRFAEDC